MRRMSKRLLTLCLFRLGTVIFQTVIFGLTLYKFLQFAMFGLRDVPLIVLLIRDGTWRSYCCFVSSILLNPHSEFSAKVSMELFICVN